MKDCYDIINILLPQEMHLNKKKITASNFGIILRQKFFYQNSKIYLNSECRIKIIELLLAKGASISNQNKLENTPLHEGI